MKIRSAIALVGASLVATTALSADIAVIHREITVNQSAQLVWSHVGGYCAIAEWLQVTCSHTAGEGRVGSVRLLNNAIVEVMVAQTPLSYTYHQTVGNMAAYGYHGTLAVESTDGGNQSRIIYTLVYDQESMPQDKRDSERARLQGRFQTAIETMKTIAERR